MECQYSPVVGDVVACGKGGCLEVLDVRRNSEVKRVDRFIEKIGLKVVDLKGVPVLLSNYMEDHEDGLTEQPKKIVTKGKRELRNLECEMNDGKVFVGLDRATRLGRGK